MKYLSIDLESTGLDEHDLMIEFAAIPFDAQTGVIEESLLIHHYIQCPSFAELKPKLNPWVAEHNEKLICKAHQEGLPLKKFKEAFTSYLESPAVKDYFGKEKIILFGKSMNAIDLPFLNRDLGWDYMRQYFAHRTNDLTSVVLGLIDLGKLPPQTISGSELMKYLNMGDVAHTALEDARNTAKMYLKIKSQI